MPGMVLLELEALLDPLEPVVLLRALTGPEECEAVGDASMTWEPAGMTATANGTSARPRTPTMAPTGYRDMSRAAGVGSLARAGISGKMERPMSPMMGPLAASVPPKLRSSPSPCPVTQYPRASAMPRPMKAWGRREIRGPRPMTMDAADRITATETPAPVKAWPKAVSRWAYQPGCPCAVADI